MNRLTFFLRSGTTLLIQSLPKWKTEVFMCLLLINLVISPVFLAAQGIRYNSAEKNTDAKGYIVNANYDTIQGSVHITEPHYMEYNIDFTEGSASNSKIKRPNDIIGFTTLNVMGKETFWLSTNYSILDHPPEEPYLGTMPSAFVNVVVRGPITIYYYYNFKVDSEPQNTSSRYMVLPDKTVIDVSPIVTGFSKKFPKYFEDYADLAKKISKKEKGYKAGQIEKIAREYNEWYLAKNPDFNFFTVDSKKAEGGVNQEIIFSSEVITFAEYPGIKFWLSEPFKRYQKWDTEKTGIAKLSVALKIENKSGKAIAKIVPGIKSFDKNGKVISQSSGGTAPELFEPNPGNTIPDGYMGIYNSFYSTDLAKADNFDRVEFTLNELGYASAAATDKPVFNSDWVEFDNYAGLKFRLSEPFVFVDDLSGNNRFGIALEFNNKSDKEVKFCNFQIKVYDDQGLLFDEERQNHTGQFDPGVRMGKFSFPVNYQGVNKKFYANEESFMKVFKKIEFNLNSVEY